jgi:uncharacterized protein YprB with RNaseH-like and TPR domain
MAEELGRSVNSIKNKMYALNAETENDWLDELRIGFFDIETTNLKANIGNMVSWAMLPLDGDKVTFKAWTRAEAIDWKKMDRRITEELVAELDKYDMIMTYYGTNFDNKFIRTRAMLMDIPFPRRGQVLHHDLYYDVRGNMALYSNRLAVVTQSLGIEGKTPLPASIWGEARLGYPKAMKWIKEHNVEDVKILKELWPYLKPHVRVTRRSI